MHQRRYFGTDGIRDVANSGHLTPDMVLRVGHAIGRVVYEHAPTDRRPAVVLVRDTRISGPMISRILTGAILAHGVDVLDAEVLPTPAAALLVLRNRLQMGIVVSASHNPMQDNGIKLFGADGRKLSDDTELAIERYIDQAGSRDVVLKGAAVGRFVSFREGADIYLESMTRDHFLDLDLSAMKIVLDCSHGSGSFISPRVLAALGADVTTVNHEPDGCNINVAAGVFHAAALADVIRKEGAHIGMALDGDGDRVILVDENGVVRDGDHMLAILSRRLGEDSDRQLVATVMSNMGLRVLAREAGITLHETPVGDRYVAERMEKTGARIGGEQSGHIIFHTEHGWIGDGLYTALRVVEVMLEERKPLSALADAMERFPQVLQNVVVSEKPAISEIPALQEAIRRHQLRLGDEGRILVRYSGTEMLARVMVEGRTAEVIDPIVADLVAVLRRELGA